MKTITVQFVYDEKDIKEFINIIINNPHSLSSKQSKSTPDEIANYQGRINFVKALNESNDWWCPNCKCIVQPNCVTFSEEHDPRYGGCGANVYPKCQRPLPN